MVSVTTRAAKGSALTHTEMDENFLNMASAVSALSALSVRDFGVVADGVTDDGPAINAMTAYVRGLSGQRPPIYFPPGDYYIGTSLDFTDLRPGSSSSGIRIIGDGARFLGNCAGQAVIDCTRSLQLRFEGLTIIGDAVNTPKYGFQFARGNSGESADAMLLIACTTKGNFTKLGVLNFASERFLMVDCIIRNYASGADKFAMAIDGQNYYGASSLYYPITIPQYTAQSCLNHSFLSTSFGSGEAGSTGGGLQIINASRVSMVGCYVIARGNRPGVEIGVYNATTAFAAFNLDLHMEPEGDIGNAFLFTNLGTATTVTIDGFAWKENSLHVASPVFGNGLSGQVILRGIDISISGKKPSATSTIFSSTAFNCAGKLAWTIAGTAPAGLGVAYFTGELTAPDFTGVALPTGGTYTTVAYSGASPTRTHYGVNLFATNVYSNGPLLGYTTGAGGTVTQLTDKSTAVTLDKACGTITTHGQSLAAGAIATFTLNNTFITTSVALILHRRSGGSASSYNIWVDSVIAGSATICIKNISAGALAEAVNLRFAVLNVAVA